MCACVCARARAYVCMDTGVLFQHVFLSVCVCVCGHARVCLCVREDLCMHLLTRMSAQAFRASIIKEFTYVSKNRIMRPTKYNTIINIMNIIIMIQFSNCYYDPTLSYLSTHLLVHSFQGETLINHNKSLTTTKNPRLHTHPSKRKERREEKKRF